MKIEAVDFFYLSMPEITTEADGSQDALLVRVAAGGHVGWGECEASPLVSIAAFVCPMSHGVCQPVADSVLGADDRRARPTSPHRRRASATTAWTCCRPRTPGPASRWRCGTCSGKARGRAGLAAAGLSQQRHTKTPYASQLFGDTPAGDAGSAAAPRARHGFTRGQVRLGPVRPRHRRGGRRPSRRGARGARRGRHPAGRCRPDLGRGRRGRRRAPAGARGGTRRPGSRSRSTPAPARPMARSPRAAGSVRLAGGEAAHNVHMARHLIDYGQVGFIQIDCGRIGGIGPAKQVADYAVAHGVTYVNHTFTSHLALSASLQPYRRPGRSHASANTRSRRSRSPGISASITSCPTPPARFRYPKGSAWESRSTSPRCKNTSCPSRSRSRAARSTALPHSIEWGGA